RSLRASFEPNGFARCELLGATPLDRVAEPEAGQPFRALIRDGRPDQERAIRRAESVLRDDAQRRVVKLLPARLDDGGAVRLDAGVDARVDALPRERAEIGEELSELVFAAARIGRIDDVAARLGEPRAASERVDDEDDLVVLDHEIARLPGGVRTTELL